MAISMVSVTLVPGLFLWFYITMRIKGPLERRFTILGELLCFLFFVAGIVGILVAVTYFVGPIT